MPDALTGEMVDLASILQKRLSDGIYSHLATEALELRPVAEKLDELACEREPDGAVNGRGRCMISGPRDKLRSFHSGIGLEMAREFSGHASAVFPTRASYLYYETGDFSFFHHDAVHAHITVIVGLSEDLLPLLLYPDFGPVSANDVMALNDIKETERTALARAMEDKFGARSRSSEVEILNGHAVAIRGRRVPHARARQPTPAIVCTACYSFLRPPRDWQLP